MKALLFTLLTALSINISQANPFAQEYNESRFIKRLFNETGIQAGNKNYLDLLNQTKNQRAKPRVKEMLQDIHELFYLKGKRAPLNEQEVKQEKEFLQQKTYQEPQRMDDMRQESISSDQRIERQNFDRMADDRMMNDRIMPQSADSFKDDNSCNAELMKRLNNIENKLDDMRYEIRR